VHLDIFGKTTKQPERESRGEKETGIWLSIEEGKEGPIYSNM